MSEEQVTKMPFEGRDPSLVRLWPSSFESGAVDGGSDVDRFCTQSMAARLAQVGVTSDDCELIKKLGERTSLTVRLKRECSARIRRQLIGVNYIEALAGTEIVCRLFFIGTVLNMVEDLLPGKAEFVAWRREMFGDDRGDESLRQARKIARMGAFAVKYAPVGKSRMLSLYYRLSALCQARAAEEKPPTTAELLTTAEREYPFTDGEASSASKVEKMRHHIDTIVTKATIDLAFENGTICGFDDAERIVERFGHAFSQPDGEKLFKALRITTNQAGLAHGFQAWLKADMPMSGRRDSGRADTERIVKHVERLADWGNGRCWADERLIDAFRNRDAAMSLTAAHRAISAMHRLIFPHADDEGHGWLR